MDINKIKMGLLQLDTRLAYYAIGWESKDGANETFLLSANSLLAAWRTFVMLGIGLFLDIREISLETFTDLQAEALFITSCRRLAC